MRNTMNFNSTCGLSYHMLSLGQEQLLSEIYFSHGNASSLQLLTTTL